MASINRGGGTDTSRAQAESLFTSTSAIFQSPISFAIISYGSSLDHSPYSGFARCKADEAKLLAARKYIIEQDSNMKVWVDCVSWHEEGVEQYNYNAFKTLGAIYKYAKYTLAIVEGADAVWIEEIAKLWQRYMVDNDIKALAESFNEEERCSNFDEKVRKNPYSYWNRAWVLQEILQSNGILYCSWDGKILKPIITGSGIGQIISALPQDMTPPDLAAKLGDAKVHKEINAELRQMWMRFYLLYSVPPTIRARHTLSYHYQHDLSLLITNRIHYASDRKNALEAMAVLLGLEVYPVENAFAKAVHHAMIKNGGLPTSNFKDTRVPQTSSNSSWAPGYLKDSSNSPGFLKKRSKRPELFKSTEELTHYLPTPIPGEIHPDGRLGLSGCGITATIMPETAIGKERVRKLHIDSQHAGTIPASFFNVPEQKERRCLLLRTEIIALLVCPESHVLLGSYDLRIYPLKTDHIAENDWQTRFVYIK